MRPTTFDTGVVQLALTEGPPSGPPFVCIPAFTWSRRSVDAVLAAFAADWRVSALDLRGHGDSGRVAGRYGVADYADDVEAYLSHLGLPAVIYGHSLGGRIAMTLAARRPNLVRALIVGDTPLYSDSIAASAAAQRVVFSGQRALLRRCSSIDALAAALADLPVPNPRQEGATIRFGELNSPDRVRYTAECLAQLDPDALDAAIDGQVWHGYDPDATLPALRMPTLLLQGDPSRNALMTDADVRRALAVLPNGQHALMTGLGHSLQLRRPAPVIEAIRAFLQTV